MKHRIEFGVPAHTFEIVGTEGNKTDDDKVAGEVCRLLKGCLCRDFEELHYLFLSEAAATPDS